MSSRNVTFARRPARRFSKELVGLADPLGTPADEPQLAGEVALQVRRELAADLPVCSFAPSSGFLRGCLNRDLLRLRLRRLLDREHEDALLELRLDRVRIDAIRKGEGAHEVAVRTLVRDLLSVLIVRCS